MSFVFLQGQTHGLYGGNSFRPGVRYAALADCIQKAQQFIFTPARYYTSLHFPCRLIEIKLFLI